MIYEATDVRSVMLLMETKYTVQIKDVLSEMGCH